MGKGDGGGKVRASAPVTCIQRGEERVGFRGEKKWCSSGFPSIDMHVVHEDQFDDDVTEDALSIDPRLASGKRGDSVALRRSEMLRKRVSSRILSRVSEATSSLGSALFVAPNAKVFRVDSKWAAEPSSSARTESSSSSAAVVDRSRLRLVGEGALEISAHPSRVDLVVMTMKTLLAEEHRWKLYPDTMKPLRTGRHWCYLKAEKLLTGVSHVVCVQMADGRKKTKDDEPSPPLRRSKTDATKTESASSSSLMDEFVALMSSLSIYHLDLEMAREDEHERGRAAEERSVLRARQLIRAAQAKAHISAPQIVAFLASKGVSRRVVREAFSEEGGGDGGVLKKKKMARSKSMAGMLMPVAPVRVWLPPGVSVPKLSADTRYHNALIAHDIVFSVADHALDSLRIEAVLGTYSSEASGKKKRRGRRKRMSMT